MYGTLSDKKSRGGRESYHKKIKIKIKKYYNISIKFFKFRIYITKLSRNPAWRHIEVKIVYKKVF
jgi:hypothetical protein